MNTLRAPTKRCIISLDTTPVAITSPCLGGSVSMDNCAKLWRRPLGARWLYVALLALVFVVSLPLAARAQETAIINRGDAAVTAFSGARQIGEVPPDLHPLDRTFLDTNGAVLQVFDLTKLGGAPSGQIANAPIKFAATAGEIGQVFGVTLDGDTANATPNIYVTSTSLFGLQIVSAEGDRLVKGEPGAHWMPGQFGVDKGGSPGSVWKIDGTTGAISLFTSIKNDGKDNAGPGLGDIAYDPVTHQLFVSDLETGLIHRLGLDGSDLGTFDHGTAGRLKAGLDALAYDDGRRMNIENPSFDIENPASWGFADKRRMVFAVAVQNGRLYYSVAPQIWSVGLNPDGSFADDARLEIDAKDTPASNVITDIIFDSAGTLYVAQRGDIVGSYDYSVFATPETSVVLRYSWNESAQRWSTEPEEYAIGLKPPYRSAEGGIAFNYGYDSDGNIDYNQCRATLWTTGEHLREGEETDRIYEGGALIVHGLQGNEKTLVRPANVPPFDAWFVDYDGLYLDADVYGHIGDVAIFNPCDKRTVAEPVPLPYPLTVPYYPPLPAPTPPLGPTLPIGPTPPGAPDIFINKVCNPGIFGGEIHCTISVTNIGETPSGPINLWDAATILTGPGAGGGIIITGVTPDGPDWTCAPTPTPDLWCSLPPDALLPGTTRSIDVAIDTEPLFAAGDFGFRNCASLDAPWYGLACDDGGTDISVEKTAPAACDPGGDCTFTITITNSSSLGFDGDVTITDGMFFPDGTAILAPITAFAPALCVPPPGGLGFSCTAHLTLGPGESQVFSMTLTMPAAPPAYWAENCFAISPTGLPAPALPPVPGAHSSTTSCAWVPVGGPPPLSNIRVEKTALHGGKCSKSYTLPGTVIDCDYEIALINDGPSPFHGPLSFTDTPPAGAADHGIPTTTWICLPGPPGPPIQCSGAAPFDIPVGGSIVVPITLTLPLATLEAAGCAMPNTATLTGPLAGTDLNYFGGDDTSTATADAFLTWVDMFGVTHVTCDPTNLKVAKTAKGDCVASDGGFSCEYVVRVTNTGPDPYKGPLQVKEQLGFAPTSMQFSLPWGCTGGGASFTCTHPIIELNKGDGVDLTVTAIVSEGSQCRLRNTAALTFPTANTRFNGDARDDAASASANIPSKQCVRPERPQCEPAPNEFRSESGACVCKTGYLRDEKGVCVSVIGRHLCPDGKPVPKSGHCPVTPPQCVPGPNEERNAKGQCICKPGYERDAQGRCTTPPMPEDECREKGWIWNSRTKTCLPPPNPADECRKKGWVWNSGTKACLPPPNPADECRKKGWVWNGQGLPATT